MYAKENPVHLKAMSADEEVSQSLLIEDNYNHTLQHKPSLNLPTFKLHIAIDFGTDGIGLAYAYNNETFIHQKFKSNRFGPTIKPKTIILLDDNKEALFGLEAKLQFSHCNPTQPSSQSITT